MLTMRYFGTHDTGCDWSRFDFSNCTVQKLRECVEQVRSVSLTFTRTNHPALNTEMVELMHAVELEIRRRPLQEQYPELWEPLKSANESLKNANETIQRIATLQETQQDRLSEIRGWQNHFEKHLEPVFTNLALEYLRNNFPTNQYTNVFKDGSISNKWKDPDFELDGLIYDETANSFYMVESKYHLTHKQLSSTKNASRHFRDFVGSIRPDLRTARIAARRWDSFFGESGVVDLSVKDNTTVHVFLGFHSRESESLISLAKEESYILIGPVGDCYKVLTP